MPRPLRSNLPPTSARWATRRALWRALGLTDADMEKPKIAVVNSSSELAICFSHLDAIAARVKHAIRAAGAIPFEIRTTAPSDFVTITGKKGGYILSARDLITNDIEAQVEGAMLDGMLCLASCDKTVPGQLMAAGRLNIPTLIVCCGYQPSGQYRGQHCDIEDVFAAAGGLSFGEVTAQQMREMGDVAILGPGVCSGMGTANTMHIVSEALGMALPGSTPVMANSPAHVGRGGPRRRPHRRHGGGGPEAARHHDAGRLRQRGQGDAGDQRLDQRGEAPGGDGAGIRPHRPRHPPHVRRPRRHASPR